MSATGAADSADGGDGGDSGDGRSRSAERNDERFEVFVDPVDGTRWSIDVGFLGSTWRCRWGDGCVGILDTPAPERQEGCCSVGAQLLDEAEARTVSALGMSLDPRRFQHHRQAAAGGVLTEVGSKADPERQLATRVVDGACIFLNRPGFDGGVGCALHLAAVDEDERPMDWKPSVCWQLPLKVDRPSNEGETAVRLRRWGRPDWGSGGDDMAWCCTEKPDDGTDQLSAFDGDEPVVSLLADELQALLGAEVAEAVRQRVVDDSG